jgi:hypothetical protein
MAGWRLGLETGRVAALASRALLGKRPNGLQRYAKPAVSFVGRFRVDRRGAEPGRSTEGHGGDEEPGSAALENLPAYGVLNVWKVPAGTGEALRAPAILRCFRRSDQPPAL